MLPSRSPKQDKPNNLPAWLTFLGTVLVVLGGIVTERMRNDGSSETAALQPVGTATAQPNSTATAALSQQANIQNAWQAIIDRAKQSPLSISWVTPQLRPPPDSADALLQLKGQVANFENLFGIPDEIRSCTKNLRDAFSYAIGKLQAVNTDYFDAS